MNSMQALLESIGAPITGLISAIIVFISTVIVQHLLDNQLKKKIHYRLKDMPVQHYIGVQDFTVTKHVPFTPPYMVFHPLTHELVKPVPVQQVRLKEDGIGCFEYENGVRIRVL